MDCSRGQDRVPSAMHSASPSHDTVRMEGANMTQRTVGKAALFPLQPNRCTQSENEEGNGRRNLFFPLAIGPPFPRFQCCSAHNVQKLSGDLWCRLQH